MAPNRLIVGGGGKIISSITIITTTCSRVFRGWIFERCHFNFKRVCENTVILALLDDFVQFLTIFQNCYSRLEVTFLWEVTNLASLNFSKHVI